MNRLISNFMKMKKSFLYTLFGLLTIVLLSMSITPGIAQIYENCPNQELSFSIMDLETKMCASQGRGGRGSEITFMTCNPDPVQCCPGLDFPPEPLCISLAP